ncbi:N-acetylglucosamine kinase-like BadF-type ATPase [Dulcicalothrix desertica PCC 7102]|nr:N-acetylglucosamine kinase-like BadF-type ATPase [Dulcicalothrix desertica PCC 7102]
MTIYIFAYMYYVLGIDGGGTKTICLVMNEQRQILGRGEAGASNYQSIGANAALISIESAIKAAIEQTGKIQVQAICLGLAGAGRSKDIEVIQGIIRDLQQSPNLPIEWILPNNIIICHDALTALVGGIGNDVGVVVAAGTGTIVFGRNQQGQTKRVGGWGYILGDEGGAYNIAVAGMKAAMRAYDGRELSTCLVEDFKNQLGLESIEDLIEVVYRRGWGVREIASLAPVVDNAAVNGDEVAREIIDEGVRELVKATRVVVTELVGDDFEIVTVGSVWKAKSNIRKKFMESICAEFGNVRVILPRYEPAYGACLLALKQLHFS